MSVTAIYRHLGRKFGLLTVLIFTNGAYTRTRASYITVFFDKRVDTHATVCLCCAETLSVDLQTGQAVSSAA